ncbi:MAG: hypothetical protein JWO97_2631 [Acidobacteria bacterium]|nr:hypothetical protein [Acidobacteriota bacterium]
MNVNENAFETNEFEGEFEFLGEGEGESQYESYESQHESQHEYEGEDRELELAAELLSISGERELDEFFGKLLKGVKGVLNTPAGQKLKGLLRDTAKKALPLGGEAIGSYFGGNRGGQIGTQAGNLASSIFGLELEGMSGEDREFEMAKQFVRLSTTAANNLASAPRNGNPQLTAQRALASAAQRHAPGLVTSLGGGSCPGNATRPATGRWFRRGRRIVVVGL